MEMLERRRWKNENFSDRSIFPSKETRFSLFSNFLSYFSYYFSILLLFPYFPTIFSNCVSLTLLYSGHSQNFQFRPQIGPRSLANSIDLIQGNPNFKFQVPANFH